jgi:hypothetical protein
MARLFYVCHGFSCELGTNAIRNQRKGYRRAFTISAVVVLVLLATAATRLAFRWPFTLANMQKELATATSGSVQTGTYDHTSYGLDK